MNIYKCKSNRIKISDMKHVFFKACVLANTLLMGLFYFFKEESINFES